MSFFPIFAKTYFVMGSIYLMSGALYLIIKYLHAHRKENTVVPYMNGQHLENILHKLMTVILVLIVIFGVTVLTMMYTTTDIPRDIERINHVLVVAIVLRYVVIIGSIILVVVDICMTYATGRKHLTPPVVLQPFPRSESISDISAIHHV